ncbi:MAG: Rpn family recombination-promoting nuclease/putative transposase [Desulfovibrio sp.]|nr:Rpn family recombination-promoting nuclease/putative transposase [Desulfovibrio sp.]
MRRKIARSPKRKRSAQDIIYKRFFSVKEVVRDLIHFFLPEEARDRVDLSTLERFPATNSNKELRERREDLIWRVRTKDGVWCYLYFLIEFQSSNDPEMIFRIFEYLAIFLRALYRADVIKMDKPLPLFLPVVIYNGLKPWSAVKSLSDMQVQTLDVIDLFQPKARYFLIDIGRLKQELVQNEGLPTILFKLERAKGLEELHKVIKESKNRVSGEHYLEIRRILTAWINNIGIKRINNLTNKNIKIPDNLTFEETCDMFEENLKIWVDEIKNQGKAEGIAMGKAEGIAMGKAEGIAMGKAEGIAMGKAEVKYDIAKNLINMGLSVDQIEKATGLESSVIHDIKTNKNNTLHT